MNIYVISGMWLGDQYKESRRELLTGVEPSEPVQLLIARAKASGLVRWVNKELVLVHEGSDLDAARSLNDQGVSDGAELRLRYLER